MMMFLNARVLWPLMVGIMTAQRGADAFIPPFGATTGTTTSQTQMCTIGNRQRENRNLVQLWATVEDEKTATTRKSADGILTEHDEEILFGDAAATTSHAKPSVTGPLPLPSPSVVTGAVSEHRAVDPFGNVLPDAAKKNKMNLQDHAVKDPLINKLSTIRQTLQSCPELWLRFAEACPDKLALLDEHLSDQTVSLTFAQMSRSIQQSAQVFSDLGVRKNVNVAIFAENSARWLQADHGIQLAGGVSAVRGADAPLDELRYIYEHSDSKQIAVLQGPKLLEKLVQDSKSKKLKALGFHNEKYGPVQTIILLNREKKSNEQIEELGKISNVSVLVFADLLEKTTSPSSTFPKITRDDIATIVYTSGTTGHPKGVVLTHGNLLHQTGHRIAPNSPLEESEPLPGEVMLSLLPVWHITERTFELWMASRGCTIVYSSIRTFKNDLAKHRPQWMVLVPRVLEKVATGVQDKFAAGSPAVRVLSTFFTNVAQTHAKHRKIVRGLVVADEPPGVLEKLASNIVVTLIAPLHAVGTKLVWSKVQEGFGGRIKVIISGGSALAGGLETFYEAAGLNICVGYGLTECAPLLSYRRRDANLVAPGCAGRACLDTELRIVDPDSKATVDGGPRPSLPLGQAGVVIGRGPQVMKGYYKNEEATHKAVDMYGWFDTGDLGRINPATGDLILTGRAKDTIVLSNGENIEPQPIEDAILGESPLVDQIMLTGQDGRHLVAVAVLNPTEIGAQGFVDREQAKALQEAHDKVNDPKCTEEASIAATQVLNEAAKTLRTNGELKKALMADVQLATKSKFRKWEQVADVYITLEPFAMVNGQLTQSYKIKRASVQERYADVLAKLMH